MKQAVRHLIRRVGCGHEILCKAMAAVSWYLPAKQMHLEASLNWWDDAGWGPMTYMFQLHLWDHGGHIDPFSI